MNCTRPTRSWLPLALLLPSPGSPLLISPLITLLQHDDNHNNNSREQLTMALPKQLQAGMTPDEYTFLAEEQLIDIVPNVAISRIRLLSGMYGPFRPPTKATVPLWLALSLKRKRKCRIVPPSWLNAGTSSRHFELRIPHLTLRPT